MDKTNSTNILDSKDRVLKLENLSFEIFQELEKAPHEIYVQDLSKNEKNEANDNSTVNENLNNADDPRNWSSKKKLFVLLIVAICGITTPLAGTIHFPALIVIQKDFNASILAIDTFGIGPIVWAAYSDELATRKKVYIVSFLVFISASVVCATATNIWLLTAMRSIQAIGNSAVLPLSAGVISDIYDPIGTTFGGFIAQYLGWRWIFWILTIFGGFLFILILFFLPETFNVNYLKANPSLRFNPIAPLKLFKHPHIILIVTYICISTIILQIQNISIPINFSARYNFTSSQIGMFLIAPSSGFMLGSLLGGKYSDYLSKKSILSSGGVYYPEVRIKSAWFGSLLFPVTGFIYGWLLDISFNIYVLAILIFLCSFGTLITFSTLSTYLVDACPGRGASVMSLVSLIRFCVPGIIMMFETSIEESLGVRWMFALISIICFLSISFLIVVYINGKKWRSRFVVPT
ncbi:16046_t:CDS:2 [Cetraspora pellucida]|uniref:16046_t:CDS:1 n=1 Tax=Cetraspora pellucida TaxID=1433469 RepID=A0A9N8ZBJ1_9GLOM|nr:16046_t:CDS:2 [Cetraspora pellucida]